MIREYNSWMRTSSKRITCLWAFLFVVAGYHFVVDAAAFPDRPSSARSGFGSSPSEDSSRRRVVMEPAFENAGKTAGLEIWRIEDFKPVAYPQNDYGKFYTGDSYIILYTKERVGTFSWDIHFWLGSQTSQDESGAAAILTVALDEQLGGDPVQYREVQEHESQLFLSHFKSGVRYLPGGVSSGFAHVDPNAFEKKLFQIKGKRNIRVKQVDCSIASMNKGDCFILDAGNDIYVYVGSKSKRTERLKAVSAANLIKDQDHAGRARVHLIDQTSHEDETQQFFTALGSGSADSVPDETSGGDDEQFEHTEEDLVALYRVSDGSGKMALQQVGQKPLRQQLLDTNDCFIIDTINANLFVWIGKLCNKKEKDEAMSKAQEFLSTKHYPSWTHVERIVEGAETSIFRQYFQTWQGAGELHPRLIRSAAARPTQLAEKSGGLVPEFMPDDGSGELEIYRIENFELAAVDPDNYGKFFGGDSYVIKYRTTNGKWIIYIWQGHKSSIDEKAASAIHAVQMDDELKGVAVQIRVVQDHEPKHFLNIFKGKMIVFLGGHVSGFKNIKEHDTYVNGETRLYRIRGTSGDDVRASQQKPVASSLESDDVFIAENGENAWIWVGNEANDVEKHLADGFLQRLVSGMTATTITEGSEPQEFWDALGGRTSYTKNFKDNLQVVNQPQLYHAHVKSNGKVEYEEIHNFDQEDLDEDDVMVLDATEEIFMWIGKDATIDEQKQVFKQLSENLKRYNRENAVIITVKQGEETELFTSLFSSWSPNLFSELPKLSAIKQTLADNNKNFK